MSKRSKSLVLESSVTKECLRNHPLHWAESCSKQKASETQTPKGKCTRCQEQPRWSEFLEGCGTAAVTALMPAAPKGASSQCRAWQQHPHWQGRVGGLPERLPWNPPTRGFKGPQSAACLRGGRGAGPRRTSCSPLSSPWGGKSCHLQRKTPLDFLLDLPSGWRLPNKSKVHPVIFEFKTSYFSISRS